MSGLKIEHTVLKRSLCSADNSDNNLPHKFHLNWTKETQLVHRNQFLMFIQGNNTCQNCFINAVFKWTDPWL